MSWTAPFLTLAVMVPLMALLWVVQMRTRDAGIVDVGWSAGLGAAGILCAVLGDGDPTRRLLLGSMAGIWGFRLAGHLLTDRILGDHGEDGRYQKMRRDWGEAFDRRMFWFFQAQGVLVAILAIPFAIAASRAGASPDAWDWAAIAIWLIAVGGESLADRQLAAFRSDPAHRGKTCRDGLWRYSRHPNYFFEWLHWWAYVLLAITGPLWWLALIGPSLMLLFILKVTGIPPTEARALESRGEDYRDYQRTTSAFFPWFPRKRAS